MNEPTGAPTTDDVVEAFLRLCEALGVQATARAYLEVPAIIRAAEERGARWATELS